MPPRNLKKPIPEINNYINNCKISGGWMLEWSLDAGEGDTEGFESHPCS